MSAKETPQGAPLSAAEKEKAIQAKARAKLDALKKQIDTKREIIKKPGAFNLVDQLQEIKKASGASDVQWEKMRGGIRAELVAKLAKHSPEFKKMHQMQKNTVKKTINEAKKSPTKMNRLKTRIQRAAEHFGGSKKETKSLVASLIKMVGAKSFLGKFLIWAFNLNKKKATAKKTSAKKPGQKPPQKPVQTPSKPPENLAQADVKLVAKFREKFSVESSTVKNDLNLLRKTKSEGKEIDIAKLIEKSNQSGSRLSKFRELIKKSVQNKEFKFRLADLKFELPELKDTQFEKMIKIIENKDSKYKLEKTPAKIREFLDAVNKSNDIDKTLATYKKPDAPSK